MKSMLVLAVMLFGLSAQALEVKLTCQTTMKVSGEAVVSYEPFTLNSESASSKMIENNVGFDQNNSLLFSLNKTSSICGEGGCDDVVGKVYTLSLVRFENAVRKAAQLQSKHKEKVKGQTSATVEFKVMDSGDVTANYFQDGEYHNDRKLLPRTVSFNYSVSRGFLKKRQNIEVFCKIKVNKPIQ